MYEIRNKNDLTPSPSLGNNIWPPKEKAWIWNTENAKIIVRMPECSLSLLFAGSLNCCRAGVLPTLKVQRGVQVYLNGKCILYVFSKTHVNSSSRIKNTWHMILSHVECVCVSKVYGNKRKQNKQKNHKKNIRHSWEWCNTELLKTRVV